jgi:hypothetical protein
VICQSSRIALYYVCIVSPWNTGGPGVPKRRIDNLLSQDLFENMMEPIIPLSELPLDQIMERARHYRAMALTASTLDTKDSLNRLAERYVNLAESRGAGPGRLNEVPH